MRRANAHSPFRRHEQQRSGLSPVEVLLTGSILLILLTLLLPAMRRGRDAARQIQCMNNLFQIGLALHCYEHIARCLPPGSVNDSDPVLNEPIGYHISWIAQSLPMMDQTNLYEAMDWTTGAYSATTPATNTTIPSLQCPSDHQQSMPGASTYAGCIGGSSLQLTGAATGLFYLNSHVTDTMMQDGRANTILVGEKRISPTLVRRRLLWPSGTSATLRSSGVRLNATDDRFYQELTADAGGFGSWHNGQINILLADGAVRPLAQETSLSILTALGDRNDRRAVPSPWRRPGLPVTVRQSRSWSAVQEKQ